ncbi:MAG TPA: methyltransferase domain-containing protein, partial [Gemmatimonadales bacterium]|nr:methyltransferase domain-containing protein [Gemmatimonadales bacterium]
GYEGYMVPALFEPWALRLIEVASPRDGEDVLDLGCGTGIVARRIASRTGSRVTGLDLNPDMLEVARSASAAEQVNIEWRQGKAEALPYSEGSFDLVVSQFALMFFENQQAALSETRRVLRPGGRLAVSVWQGLERHPFYQTLHMVLGKQVGNSTLDTISALGDPEELRSLLSSAGFERIRIKPFSMTSRFPQPDVFLAGEIEVDAAAIPAMQRLTPAARQAIVKAISEEMKGPLQEVTFGNEVVLEFHANLALAWR